MKKFLKKKIPRVWNANFRDFRCTRGRDRTGTSVTSSVFETDASPTSATWASVLF